MTDLIFLESYGRLRLRFILFDPNIECTIIIEK